MILPTGEVYNRVIEGKLSLKEGILKLYPEEGEAIWKLLSEDFHIEDYWPFDSTTFYHVVDEAMSAISTQKEGDIERWLDSVLYIYRKLILKDLKYGQHSSSDGRSKIYDYFARYKYFFLTVHIDSGDGIATVTLVDLKDNTADTVTITVDDPLIKSYKKNYILQWTIVSVREMLLYYYIENLNDEFIDPGNLRHPYLDIFLELLVDFKDWADSVEENDKEDGENEDQENNEKVVREEEIIFEENQQENND